MFVCCAVSVGPGLLSLNASSSLHGFLIVAVERVLIVAVERVQDGADAEPVRAHFARTLTHVQAKTEVDADRFAALAL